jgi:hypothetical protein
LTASLVPLHLRFLKAGQSHRPVARHATGRASFPLQAFAEGCLARGLLTCRYAAGGGGGGFGGLGGGCFGGLGGAPWGDPFRVMAARRRRES